MKFLLLGFLVGVLEVPFIKGEQPRWRAGHSYPRPLPQEIMVDAVNYIGLVLLHAHNENNENNIALSPYGATSVLVALGEGVQGTALNEILRATLLPLDVSVTRVGLRDIHRHLKSYFIPQEGFLAGLTFSHENVTLKSSCEEIIRFYGYDVDSFNNALYPDPYTSTTNIGSESTTESLSSVSHAANFSSSTEDVSQTTPATVDVSSTIENSDDFNSSKSTGTIETTQTTIGQTESITLQTTQVTNIEGTTVQPTQMSTVVSDAIPESTSVDTVATPKPSATTVTTTVPVTTTSVTTVPVIITTTAVPVTTITTSTPSVTTTTTTTTTTTALPATTTTTGTTARVTTTTPSEGTAASTTTPSAPAVTAAQPTTFSSASTNGVIITSSEPVSSIRTRSTVDTTIQAITSSTAEDTSIPTAPPINTITTSQGITYVPTSEETQSDTSTRVSNAATTTTIAPSTRPTAVTISVVPSTLGSGNGEASTVASTTGTTPTTPIQGTGPILIDLNPTTIASTNSITESTTATESVPLVTSVSSSAATTTGNTAAISSTTLNPESTTFTPTSESSAFTIDLAPSTIGTGSTPTDSTTTGNPIPTLITQAGKIPDGLEININVGSSPVTTTSADITMTENERNARIVTNTSPKSKLRPRFRDDVELMKSLEFENKSAAIHKVAERSFMFEFSNSKNSFSDQEKLKADNTKLLKNVKDIIIDASIGRTSPDSPTAFTPDFPAHTTSNDYDSKLSSSAEFNTTDINSSMNEPDLAYLNDEDVIIVNRETDLEEESNAEIVLSEEEMSSESSNEKLSNLTEGELEEKTRGTRSVVDYLIARYHDNNPTDIHISTGAEYEPVKPTTFAVNGKIRESNINFMTYDTVLPFRYISYLNALALTFPLDSDKYYLLLILPLDEMGIDNLITNMMSTTLKQIIYHLQPTRVKATIPSFMLKGYVVLTPTLQKLGIRQIFEPRHADFSRMTDDKDIYVTNIEQAVTVTIRNYVDPSTLQNNQHFRRRGPVQFTADHPFLYFVMDSQIHVALMAGKIINPLNSRIR